MKIHIAWIIGLLAFEFVAACSQKRSDDIGGHQALRSPADHTVITIPDRCKPDFIMQNDKITQALAEDADKLGVKGWKSEIIATTYDAEHLSQIWSGCPIEMLSTSWGAPDRQITLPGGSVVLTWEADNETDFLTKPLPTCAASVTTNKNGSILGVATRQTNIPISWSCKIDRRSGPILLTE